jgi:hypothetical protein
LPRAMTIDGNNETGKAASSEAKLHTADLHPEIDLIVRWSDAKPSLAELRRRHGDPLWGRVDALDDLIVSRGRQHKVSCAYDDQRLACKDETGLALQNREIDGLALDIAANPPATSIFDELIIRNYP